MSLSASPQALQQHLDEYAKEITALLAGKKSSAPKARKHLQVLKEMCQRLRSEVLGASKPEKKDTATIAPAEPVAAAATSLLELATPIAENTKPPKAKRVRKAPKKLI